MKKKNNTTRKAKKILPDWTEQEHLTTKIV